MNRQDAFKLAIANIAAFSDTDVFPSPLDRLACQDAPDLVLKMLEEVDRTFDQFLASLPPENIDTLAPSDTRRFVGPPRSIPFGTPIFFRSF